jgi:hypothetical protein
MRFPFSLRCAVVGLGLASVVSAAPVAAYRPVSSGSWVQDKNFYVLTLFEHVPAVRSELTAAKPLGDVFAAKAIVAAQDNFQAAITAICFSDLEIESVRAELIHRLPHSPALQALVTDHLRPSGRYIQSADKTDADLLGEAWLEAAHGMNHVIQQFALGKADTGIDSPSYDPSAPGYQKMILAALRSSADKAKATPDSLFFEPSLNFVLRLLEVNRRDEPARHEPLAQGENRAAMEAAKHTDWTKYPYASLLIHGIDPGQSGAAISEESRANCAVAAKLYRDGLAPFIIPSGGYVHPKQTIFSEAIEMKKELMLVYGIPESAILIDPQARHTTTNVRNAVRLLFAIGAPTNKPSVSVSIKEHIDSIVSEGFQNRCLKVFGYSPAQYGKRFSDNAAEFLPSVECLQTGEDPLDP